MALDPNAVVYRGPPLSLPIALPDLGTLWRQSTHPVFNAHGRQVGSYETLDALCAGHWLVFKGEVQPPPSELYVHGPLGTKVPLASRCVKAAQLTAKGSLIAPTVTPASAAKAVSDANATAPAAPFLNLPVDLSSILGTGDQAGQGAAGGRLMTYALYGTIGLLGLSLLFSGGGSSRRR